jgi:hypothetical protein
VALKTASFNISGDVSNLEKTFKEAFEVLAETIGTLSFILIAFTDKVDCVKLRQVCKKILPCPFTGVHTPVFFTERGLMTEGIGIWAAGGDDITASTFLLEDPSGDSWDIGENAACRFMEKNPENGVFLHFPETASLDRAEFLHGFYGRVGPGFRHLGGAVSSEAAGGYCHFTEKGMGKRGGTFALIEGMSIGVDFTHGYSPIGSPVILTRSEGKRILELNFIPAAEKYRDIIRENTGKDLQDVALHPLGIPGFRGELIVRDVVHINADGSLECIISIPELSPLLVLSGTKTGIFNGINNMCGRLKKHGTAPRFVLAFDCITKEPLLGEMLHTEPAILREGLESLESLWGMFTFGEICDAWGSPLFMNKTLAVGFGA